MQMVFPTFRIEHMPWKADGPTLFIPLPHSLKGREEGKLFKGEPGAKSTRLTLKPP